jgi:hypothetical protein
LSKKVFGIIDGLQIMISIHFEEDVRRAYIDNDKKKPVFKILFHFLKKEKKEIQKERLKKLKLFPVKQMLFSPNFCFILFNLKKGKKLKERLKKFKLCP